jgi:hypothetical protein
LRRVVARRFGNLLRVHSVRPLFADAEELPVQYAAQTEYKQNKLRNRQHPTARTTIAPCAPVLRTEEVGAESADVADGFSVGVDEWWWDEPGDSVAHDDLPALLGESGVVICAEQNKVIDAGFAAVLPFSDVVAFAPLGGVVAGGEGAAPVTQQ